MGEHKRAFHGSSTFPRMSAVRIEEVRAYLPASDPKGKQPQYIATLSLATPRLKGGCGHGGAVSQLRPVGVTLSSGLEGHEPE